MQLLNTYGVLTLKDFTYNAANCRTVPTNYGLEKAKQNTILTYERLAKWDNPVNLVGKVKKAIANQNPVIIGMQVSSTFYRVKGVWNGEHSGNVGGHAMVVVGYDDNKYGGAFEILNSWGTAWGNSGYIWVSYDAFKNNTKTAYILVDKSKPVVNDNDDVVVVNNNDNNLDVGFGKYYALLIGVSSYGDGAITDLGGLPSKDAQDLANILINKYSFNKENVVVLNNSPKENEIIKEFSKLKKKVTNKDNLLVFYAGHGVYDEKSQVGHWLPSDADMEYELNLISNSQVVDYLKAIQSKHTLLISDACFSGSIFKTREFKAAPKSVQKKYELTSRKAITSGTLKTVPNKSVFLKYLLQRLESNSSDYLSARQLFNTIEEPVMNNSPNTPQYGTIYGIGDEGGDFIFIKKQ